jgi:hypothetical protein
MADPHDKPEKSKRLQTATDRELASMVSRRERAAGAVSNVVDEEITGRHEGAMLHSLRARRPTDQRLERLEDKHDGLVVIVTRIEVSHGEMTGKLDTLVDLAGAAAVEREKRAELEAAERERARKHIVPIIKAIGIALALIAAALLGRHG